MWDLMLVQGWLWTLGAWSFVLLLLVHHRQSVRNDVHDHWQDPQDMGAVDAAGCRLRGRVSCHLHHCRPCIRAALFVTLVLQPINSGW